MQYFKSWVTLWTLLVFSAALNEARQIRLKPAVTTEDQAGTVTPRQLLFYAEEPSQSEEEQPVLIARRPSYGRAVSSTTAAPRQRTQDPPKAPPVPTLRNFNKINDDGSFTFGYEAADGSFKEETRGTDCVVRGKYGYVDPDGNKREFTYVSGNPCDPNAISQEEEDELKNKSNEDENIPANIPRRPNYVVGRHPAAKNRPAPTTLFQQSFNNDDDNIQDVEDNNQLVEVRQPLRSAIRPGLREDEQLIRTTARPLPRVTFPASAKYATKQGIESQPATTYRPQVVQLAVTPSPATIFPRTAKVTYIPSSTQSPFYDEQYRKFQVEGNAIPARPTVSKDIASNPVYTTELVYDPTSGQYNTVVYQQVPRFGANVMQQPYVVQSAPPPPAPQPTTSRLFPSTTPSPYYQQQVIQQHQQAALKQSQQLYNQQAKFQQQPHHHHLTPLVSPLAQTLLLKQNPQRFAQPILQRFPEPKPVPVQEQYQPGPSPFYFVNPLVPDQRQSLADGQIEAFLRGHNLPF